MRENAPGLGNLVSDFNFRQRPPQAAAAQPEAAPLVNTVEPTAEQITGLRAAANDEPVVMLNLLRFHERAVGVDAADGISGAEAYGRYGAEVARFLARAGGRSCSRCARPSR